MPSHPELESELTLVEQLMLALVRAGPDARPEQLARLCAEHPELSAELSRRCACLEGLGFLGRDGADETPQRVGDFRILDTLGRGGMGVVYLAEQESLQRQVALKVLRADRLAFGSARERFRREALILSRLEHRGVCPIYEVGEADGVPYLAMRSLEGETLAERMRTARDRLASGCVRLDSSDAPIDQSDAAERTRIGALVRAFESIARAAHAAHEAGLVHRDLKPGNVMITADGEPVILDFGLAADASTDLGLTLTGDQVGTPAYMAPEQIEPRGRRVDARSDVYALGVTLFECLTASRPFDASGREAMFRQILAGGAPDVRVRNRHVPRDLAVVVATAMDPEPGRRYPTALALAEDLARVLARQPIRARPAGPLLRTARWTQRNPALAAFIAFLAVGLSVTSALLVRVDGLVRDLRALALSGLAATRTERDPRASLWLALQAHELARAPESRSQLYAALARNHEVRRFPGHAAVAWHVTFSPDEGSLLSSSDDGFALIWNVADAAAPPVRIPVGSPSTRAGFDATGASVVAAPYGGVARRQDARTGAELARHPRDAAAANLPMWGVAMSPARDVALVQRHDRPFFWRLDSGEVRELEHPAQVYDACFSPDGVLAATATGYALNPTGSPPYSVRVWRVADGERIGEIESGEPFRYVCFTADGKLLLSANRDGVARVWDVERRTVVRELRHSGQLWCVAASPAGVDPPLIVTGGTGLRFWRTDGTLVEAHPLPFVFRVVFSPDGSTVCACSYGDSTARLFDLQGRQFRVLRHSSRVSWAAFSKRDAVIATAGYDGSVRLWRLGDPDLAPRGRIADVLALDIAADGAQLWTRFDQVAVAAGAVAEGMGSRIKYGAGGRARFSPSGERFMRITDPELVQVFGRDLQPISAAFRPDDTSRGEECFADFLDDEHLIVVHGGQPRRSSVWTCDGRQVGPEQVMAGSAIKFAVDLAVHRPTQRVALAGWGSRCAEVWTTVGDLVGRYVGHDGLVGGVDFSADGSRLATASADGTARLYQVDAAQQPAVVLQGHDGAVHAVAFAPDGVRVATAGEDGTARIWSVADGSEWARIDPGSGPIRHVVWSPNGDALWTAADGPDSLRRWPVDDDVLVSLARERSAPLSTEEGRRFDQLLLEVLDSR